MPLRRSASSCVAGRSPRIPLAIAVGLFGVSFGVLAASSGGMGALPADRDERHHVRRLGAVRGGLDPRRRRAADRGHRRGAAAQRPLPPDRRHRRAAPLRGTAACGSRRRSSWSTSRGRSRRAATATFEPGRLIGAGIVLWLAWVAGTVIGVIGGEALGDPAALGLDAAFPALFLALLVGQLRSRPRGGRRAARRGHRASPSRRSRRPACRSSPRRWPRSSDGGARDRASGSSCSPSGWARWRIKAAGPVLLGGRPLPGRLRRPSLRSSRRRCSRRSSRPPRSARGERSSSTRAIVGVAAGAVALALRAPMLAVVHRRRGGCGRSRGSSAADLPTRYAVDRHTWRRRGRRRRLPHVGARPSCASPSFPAKRSSSTSSSRTPRTSSPARACSRSSSARTTSASGSPASCATSSAAATASATTSGTSSRARSSRRSTARTSTSSSAASMT